MLEVKENEFWDDDGPESPLHIILRTRGPSSSSQQPTISLDTIRFVAQLCPDALSIPQWGVFPLVTAVLQQWPPEVLTYMVETFPADAEYLSFSYDGGLDNMFHNTTTNNNENPRTLTLEPLMIISKLFGQLEYLDLSQMQWSHDGQALAFFFGTLQSNRSIQEVIFQMSSSMFAHNVELQRAFQTMLAHNSSLQELSFCMVSSSSNGNEEMRSTENDDALLVALEVGLDRNRMLRRLDIGDLKISTLDRLNQFLGSKAAMRKIHFHDMHVQDAGTHNSHLQSWEQAKYKNGGSRQRMIPTSRQYLQFGNCTVGQGQLNCLIRSLSTLPVLETLLLNGPGDTSMAGDDEQALTVPLTAVLKNAASGLTRLHVNGYYLNVERMCKALEQNQTLREFTGKWWHHDNNNINNGNNDDDDWWRPILELLRDHNVTLVTLASVLETKYPLIAYYLDLNRLGRREIRSSHHEHTSVSSFVKLFSSQRAMQEDPLVPLKSDPDSIAYGLLRELPSLWCCCYTVPSIAENHRKRKRDA
jgi:hypothetical protein